MSDPRTLAAAVADAGAPDSETTTRRGVKPTTLILVFVLALVAALGAVAMIQAQSEPGALFKTGRGFGMVLGTAEAKSTVTVPIALQEGGDVEHEVAHILGDMKGAGGLARGLVLKDGSAVEITYDPALVTEDQIVGTLRQAGYAQ